MNTLISKSKFTINLRDMEINSSVFCFLKGIKKQKGCAFANWGAHLPAAGKACGKIYVGCKKIWRPSKSICTQCKFSRKGKAAA